MKWIRENDTYFAVIQNDVYNGMMCEEIMYAEIDKTQGGWQCTWEDNHIEKHKFQDLADAKQYVLLEYHKHTPFLNGPTWAVEDE